MTEPKEGGASALGRGRGGQARCRWVLLVWSHSVPLSKLCRDRGFPLHAGLLHAEGDLGVLVAEQDVCYTRRWVARAQMLAVSQVQVLMA